MSRNAKNRPTTSGQCIRGCSSNPFRRSCDDHRFHQVGRRSTLKRETIADFSYNSLLQRLNEVHSCIPPGYFRSLQINGSKFTCSRQSFTVVHDLGYHSPFVSLLCRQRLRIKQKCFSSTRTRSITPRGENSVAGNDATSEVRSIVELCAATSNDHIGKKRVL